MEHSEALSTSGIRAATARHTAQRLDHSFQLTQVVHEYRLLRAALLHLLLGVEAADQGGGKTGGMEERVVELARLNAGLDYAITDAVESFVEERERRFADVRDQATMLRELDRRKSEFLAVLSHELRNPLTPIRNSLFLLDHAAPGSEQAHRAKSILFRQTEHLTNLVEELLDMTRISRGKVELHRELIDVRNIIRLACDDHRTLFEQHQVDLRFDDPARPAWANADADRLSQVMGNLLQNAAKFTPPGGRAVVSLSLANPNVEIRVRDTGIGMEAHELKRMFEPFAQVENTLAEVVLCDIGLPDVNGYEVARTLRADPSLRSTRLFALTGYAQYADKQKALDAGFDAHLTKPPDLDKLNEMLAKEAGGAHPPPPRASPDRTASAATTQQPSGQ